MKNHVGVYLSLHTNNDKNIIEKLNQVNNKQGYIKELIKTDSLLCQKYKRKGEKDDG